MKYTKNIGNKLALMGFKFEGNNNKLGDDTTLKYDVWIKGKIDVTVEHSPGRKVIICTTCGDELHIKNEQDLIQADKILNG